MTVDAAELAACQLEYERVGSELIANESMGDSRVNLFLGVWTAAMGAALASDSQPAEFQRLLATLLLPLLVLGIVTLVRIVRRNHKTDELTDSLARFRAVLMQSSDLFYLAAPWGKERVKKRRPSLLHHGLLHPLYLANAALVGVTLLLLLKGLLHEMGGVVAWVVAGVAWLAQAFGVDQANGRAFERRREREKAFEDYRPPTAATPRAEVIPVSTAVPG